MKGNKYRFSPDETIPHMVDVNSEFVVSKPEPQPRLEVEIQVDVQTYKRYGLICKLSSQVTSNEGKLMTPPKLSLVTDTGAQVDCLSRHKLRQLGLTEMDLLKPQLSFGCANESDAAI